MPDRAGGRSPPCPAQGCLGPASFQTSTGRQQVYRDSGSRSKPEQKPWSSEGKHPATSETRRGGGEALRKMHLSRGSGPVGCCTHRVPVTGEPSAPHRHRPVLSHGAHPPARGLPPPSEGGGAATRPRPGRPRRPRGSRRPSPAGAGTGRAPRVWQVWAASARGLGRSWGAGAGEGGTSTWAERDGEWAAGAPGARPDRPPAHSAKFVGRRGRPLPSRAPTRPAAAPALPPPLRVLPPAQVPPSPASQGRDATARRGSPAHHGRQGAANRCPARPPPAGPGLPPRGPTGSARPSAGAAPWRARSGQRPKWRRCPAACLSAGRPRRGGGSGVRPQGNTPPRLGRGGAGPAAGPAAAPLSSPGRPEASQPAPRQPPALRPRRMGGPLPHGYREEA